MTIALLPLLEFLHGLAFFVLGLFILFALPRIGRVSVIWPMPLLALFAFGEALIAWDAVLAPAFGLSSPPVGRPSLFPTGLRAVPAVIACWALLAVGLSALRAADRPPTLAWPLAIGRPDRRWGPSRRRTGRPLGRCRCPIRAGPPRRSAGPPRLSPWWTRPAPPARRSRRPSSTARTLS